MQPERKNVQSRTEETPIGRGGRVAPLAIVQEGMWAQHGERPDPRWNMPSALLCKGRLSVTMLRRAFGALVERHETLRTRFAAREDGPAQIVDAPAPIAVPVVDLGALPTGAREERLRRVAIGEAGRPFDLRSEWPLRVRILRMADDEHVLLLVIHHIVADAWSMRVLLRELGVLYSAFVERQPPSLPPMSIQYADYAVWERERLRGRHLDGLLDYWTKQLAGAPALELPTDHPRRAGLESRPTMHPMNLSMELIDALRRVARGCRSSLFMVLLAAFDALLARYSGQTDILVGTPAANRGQPEVEGVIGFFVTTLVIRSDLSGDPTFRELLARVRAVAAGAYAHQELPFPVLGKALSLEAAPFRAVLALNTTSSRDWPRMAGIDSLVDLHLFGPPAGGLDVYVVIGVKGEHVRSNLIYDRALFEPRTAERMSRDYMSILAAIVADADTRLSELPCSVASLVPGSGGAIASSSCAGELHG